MSEKLSIENVVVLTREGYSVAEIAEKYNLSPRGVRQVVCEWTMKIMCQADRNDVFDVDGKQHDGE